MTAPISPASFVDLIDSNESFSTFFDPDKMFSFEKYFDKHVYVHAVFTETGAPLAEWKKIEDFMKGIKCTHIQNDYRQIKDLPQYATFTAFYSKTNMNY